MKKKDSDKSGIDLKKYEDLDGLTLQKMNFGLWLSLHRRKIMRVVIIFLIIVATVSFVYSIYSYLFYFLYGRQADTKLAQSLTDTQIDSQAYREANSPEALIAGDVSVFTVKGKYDFLVPLENHNLRHFSTFQYCLENTVGEQIVCGNSFILPNSQKYLLIIGQELDRAPGALHFVVTSLFWQRLNAHDIPDWPSYAATRADFQVGDIKYTAPESSNKNPFHSLQFSIKNNTPYHFVSVPINIVLWNGNRIVGINSYHLDALLSAENRVVNLSWPSAGERVTKVEVLPDVNILNQNVYLPYRGEVNP